MSKTHPQQRHGGARLGVGLALGVVGALSAAGALRRGSRGNGPRYYHVTTREAADDILANGFLPGWGDVGFGVYFYGSPESARAYAARGGWDKSLLGEHAVILGVEDARIRKILNHELDAAWDKSKYSDMYVLDVDEADDGHLKVDRASLYLDLGRITAGSRDPKIQTKAVVKRYSPKRLQDMDLSDPLVSISWGDKEKTVTVGDIFDHGLIEELDVEYDVSPAAELERLIEFSRWVSSLKFPLRIYRGLNLDLNEDYRSEFGEIQYWSTKERVALGFARQESMFSSDPTRKGQLLTAELRSPDLIDWVGTLAYFLTYADEYELVLEAEVQPIRVQEFRARPDLVPRRQGREVSR